MNPRWRKKDGMREKEIERESGRDSVREREKDTSIPYNFVISGATQKSKYSSVCLSIRNMNFSAST